MDKGFANKIVAVSMAAAVALTPLNAPAGDLNAEMNQMFSDLGAMGNVTTPGAFRGQAMNVVTGGNLMMRAPNKSYQLAAWQLPSLKAGCGGIDLYGGSFSLITKAQFTAMLQNIMAAAPGYFFKLALKSISPDQDSTMESLWKDLVNMNNVNISSCQAAQAMVNNVWGAFDESTVAGCAGIKEYLGSVKDRTEARTDCSTDAAAVTRSAGASADPTLQGLAQVQGNLVWAAMKRVNAGLSDAEREMFMSFIGTIVVTPATSQADNKTIRRFPPLVESLAKLLRGHADGATVGKVRIELYQCDDYTECANPVKTEVDVEPFTTKTRTLMSALSEKIRTRSAPSAAEIGFVNNTAEPVYRMLAVGNALPGSGLAETLIESYNDVIALDYAATFMRRTLELGLKYLDNGIRRNKEEEAYLQEIRASAVESLRRIEQQRTGAYTKVASSRHIIQHLMELERELRSNMPAQVKSLLDFSAGQVFGRS